MSEMISKGNLPTAIFAASDHIAIGAMRALQENGYKIPEDISVMGFDNTSFRDIQPSGHYGKTHLYMQWAFTALDYFESDET